MVVGKYSKYELQISMSCRVFQPKKANEKTKKILVGISAIKQIFFILLIIFKKNFTVYLKMFTINCVWS